MLLTIEINTEQLLSAVLQLPQPEFDEFMAQLIALKAREYGVTPDELLSQLGLQSALLDKELVANAEAIFLKLDEREMNDERPELQ